MNYIFKITILLALSLSAVNCQGFQVCAVCFQPQPCPSCPQITTPAPCPAFCPRPPQPVPCLPCQPQTIQSFPPTAPACQACFVPQPCGGCSQPTAPPSCPLGCPQPSTPPPCVPCGGQPRCPHQGLNNCFWQKDLCFTDLMCPSGQKCCQINCLRQCINPVYY